MLELKTIRNNIMQLIIQYGHAEDPMDIFIACFLSQMHFFSCEGHGRSCIYCILFISGYVIDKCVKYNIH